MPNRRRVDRDWGNGTIVGVVAGIVIVVALTASLDRDSSLVAASSTVVASESAWARALASYTRLISLRASLKIPAQWPAPWYM